MDKCPYCAADTRPGDNFCLNCGNRLTPASPSPQGDATVAAPEDWPGPGMNMGMGGPSPVAPSLPPTNWPQPQLQPDARTMAATSSGTDSDLPTLRADMPTLAVTSKIDRPGRLILRADNGEVLQEYPLDKLEMSIGRAPTSDILLSKDKLTSRRHAVVRYENGTYVLRDERSANGTFVNGQQLEEMVPRLLHDGDHVGIGEHELLFHAFTSIENEKTIAVPSPVTATASASDQTISTRTDGDSTLTTGDELHTRTMSNGTAPAAPASASSLAPLPEIVSPATSFAPSPAPVPVPAPPPAPVPVPVSLNETARRPPVSEPTSSGPVTIQRFTNLPQPSLPDIAPLMAALSTLDGQVSSLQNQLNATQEAMRNHETDIASTTNQLRAGLRGVSDRMDTTIADVARSREALAWADLIQLMEDVMNNPRDIEYVTKLARKARELNKVFQIHQNVLNSLAECNSLLRSLIGEER